MPLALMCEVGLDLEETARLRAAVRGLIPRLQRAVQRPDRLERAAANGEAKR